MNRKRTNSRKLAAILSEGPLALRPYLAVSLPLSIIVLYG
jgi:hypothetical protein